MDLENFLGEVMALKMKILLGVSRFVKDIYDDIDIFISDDNI